MNFDVSIQELVLATLNEERFYEFEIINDSYVWEISIVFVSGDDERAPQDIPAPYVKQTGAIVGGVNIATRSSNKVAIDPSVQCQPNRLQCRANLRNVNTGKEYLDFRWQDQVKPLDEYFQTIQFKLYDKDSLQAEILGLEDSPVISKVAYRTNSKS